MCPMCKIADDMMPPEFVVSMFRKIAGPTGTATPIGYLPVAPSKGDLQKFAFKLDQKRHECIRHPAAFNRKPRLATAREMLVRWGQCVCNRLLQFGIWFHLRLL
jgi:hypothetical protein